VRGSNGLRAFILTGGVALHAVSIYVVATIMPVVVGDIGGLAFFAWTATLYVAASLCSASAVPLLLSRRRLHVVYRFAFGLFLTGSLVCSLAPTMGLLLVGRLLQGLGGGMLPALAYATIKETFPASLHARAIALIGSVWGVAALIGPSIGGVFAELGAWRAAFWIDVVIGLSFIVASERALPSSIPPPKPWRSLPSSNSPIVGGDCERCRCRRIDLADDTRRCCKYAAGAAQWRFQPARSARRRFGDDGTTDLVLEPMHLHPVHPAYGPCSSTRGWRLRKRRLRFVVDVGLATGGFGGA